ncbi:hypothetical protein GCM10009753_16730 [Streptantibioticus ferralitis]
MKTIVATAPADTPSSARPNAPEEAPTWALMAGMRTTHPAKTNPSTAKKAVSAMRSAVNGVVDGLWSVPVRAVRILFSVGTK